MELQDDGLGFTMQFLDDGLAPSDSADYLNFDINQTALGIIYEQLNQQRACLNRGIETVKRCEEGVLYTNLMGYGFLVLCLLAIIGNLLNLLVYVTENIRFLFAIQMLCTKLLVNTLTMLVLLPSALRLVGVWEASSQFEQVYWRFWPYQAFLVNVFGFVGIYMTVLMIGECYVHVFFPLKSKFMCTKNNLLRIYLIIGLVSVLLAGIYPLNRIVNWKSECGQNIVFISKADPSYFLQIYERLHMFFNLLFAILIPLSLLVFMTIAIVWRLNYPAVEKTASANGNNVGKFGSEKRSVMRITLITTSLQLFSELPSVPVFAFASLFGSAALTETSNLCTLQTLSQFIGIFNVSLSFFVYLLFSPRFRQAILKRFCGQCSAPQKCVSNRSTPSQRLSNSRLDETQLLTPKNSSVQRNNSTCSADLYNAHPQSSGRFLSISSGNATTITTDHQSTISKNSEITNFL